MARSRGFDCRWRPKRFLPATAAGSPKHPCVHSLTHSLSFAPYTYIAYNRLIASRSQRVSEPCLPVNLSAYRSGTFDPTVARKTLTWGRGATPKNRVLIESYAKKAEMVRFVEISDFSCLSVTEAAR